MLAYHNDPAIKAKYVNRMKDHMKANALIQGTGWNGRKGCAVGCTFESYSHARGPIEIGAPEILMRLEDTIFENLPWDEAREFPLEFLKAIPVGADLSLVWPRFALWLLADPQFGVVQHTDRDTRSAVETVVGLYRRWVNGDKPSGEELKAAAEASWAAEAAARAARAAKAAKAAWAAEVAAWAAEAAKAAWAAEVAAWAAEAAEAAKAAPVAEAAEAAVAARAAAGATNAGFWVAARDELLRLLHAAPMAEEARL